ncbi:hypothetical protein KXX33_001320 [Aspergillus fumigatus]|nr:hypothetical protein KXX45_003780 [Aspergillus fumigatus]KMK58246.1 Transcriptional regulatory protein moc3 [Aspergillus fumigatus Z5]KAH1284599.1 hypothetical protein KXX30_000982 [Aspergillus fumigatus]KAH1305203.1 hypothetical protein KXX66_003017 [Aspergillus fumigatus]KAH1348987.1 hypothetical protein KXX33_001320 [Aspergillus fumigatus]
MGKLRSKDGCLTCRKRHVKCDQVRPVCSQCQKKNRPCLREDPPSRIRIKHYQPRTAREDSKDAPGNGPEQISHVLDQATADPVIANAASHEQIIPSPYAESCNDQYPTALVTSPYSTQTQTSTMLPKLANGSVPMPLVTSPGSIHAGTPLTHREAYLVHHFATHLGYWLDCTDASRQFTRKIPILVKQSPILLHAVLSYAARHVGDAELAEQAHERCVELLIPSLSSEKVADDDILLCAIVILRVFEQLNVMVTGSDQERHLAGCSALLRASQGREVDPSTPGLRQAAFWVYLRQCLYNACIHQQAPNVDLVNLVLLAPPQGGGDPLSDLRSETAWANTMTWICATVVHFCFGSSYPEPATRLLRWQQLSEAVESWLSNRPDTFNPIWYSEAVPGSGNPFPEIWFTADWHIMAFGFYHLACMLLAIYKPSPRFAVRGLHSTAHPSHDARSRYLWGMQQLPFDGAIIDHALSFHLYMGSLDDRSSGKERGH